MFIPILTSVKTLWRNLVESLRILGIDPGSRKTGYGLIEHSGNRTRHLASGCIKLNVKEPLAWRLHQLSTELEKLIEVFQPDCGAVEEIFFAKNASSLTKTACIAIKSPFLFWSMCLVPKGL